MFNSIRKIVFYANDILGGGRIRNNIMDINNFYTTVPESQDKETVRRLTNLLEHTTHTTAYYQNYKNILDLHRYPIIKKKQIQNSEDMFLSSGYKRSNLIKRQTSGSYGTPMCVYFSKNKSARQIAELIYYNKLPGLDVGDLYLNITTNKKNRIEKFLKNLITINPAIMNEQWHDRIVQLLYRYQNTVIIGFPSVLYPLAQYILNNTTYKNIRMKGIVTIAEPLNSKIKGKIEEVFQCPVYNRYATMETGVLGHSTGSDNTIYINRASYIVELLAFDSDRHVDEGEEGRIVITDLFSYAMPLIRYETGDTAVLISRNKYGAECIQNPEGRIIETIFSTNGLKISWAIIYDIMCAVSNVIQYQFRQAGVRNYQLHLVTSPEYTQHNEDTLNRGLRKILGESAVLDFYYTDSISPLPSGKRPMIMNSYRREKLE